MFFSKMSTALASSSLFFFVTLFIRPSFPDLPVYREDILCPSHPTHYVLLMLSSELPPHTHLTSRREGLPLTASVPQWPEPSRVDAQSAFDK
jgi:hypothetical protein